MELKPEEQNRADVYALLAVLLLAPDAQLIETLSLIPPPPDPENEFAQAWTAVISAAARCGCAALDEHAALFTAPGTPRIVPYQCRYEAGAPMHQPGELEDHLGALSEAMAILIRQQRPLAMQRAFFADHLAGWSHRCLDDIAAAPAADFYRAFARFAHAFLTLEEEAFALALQAAPTIAPIRTRKSAPTSST
jgi:TorA maturation chaperone TorD